MTDPFSASGEGARSGAPAHELEIGWELAGTDSEGRPVRLLFGETRLRRAYPGLTIGRHRALSDLVIDDPTVSRRHVRICRDAGEIIVEDLNSLNGTLVAGQPLRPFEPVTMAEGETLEIGLVTVRLATIAPR